MPSAGACCQPRIFCLRDQTREEPALQLPNFPPVSAETLNEIGERHGLDAGEITPWKDTGIFNAIYQFGGQHVLRIPRDAPPFVEAIRKESVAVPAALAAGVRTPGLTAFDDSLDLLPVPYAIYERVPGEDLGELDLGPADTPGVWREVGRDLARLHEGVGEDGPVTGLECEPLPDPRPLPEELASAGYFTSEEARWLSGWLDLLAPFALAPIPQRFRHGDLQTTNVMVRPDPPTYLALIDWGACGWGDAAHDFAGIPLRAVPSMLTGYREVAPLPEDETAEARILWRHLQISLYLLGRDPQPGLSWAERPSAMLLEILRFFLGSPGMPWTNLCKKP
jgi:aminoglycoside phosphotransferase (APT) family kinase protein